MFNLKSRTQKIIWVHVYQLLVATTIQNRLTITQVSKRIRYRGDFFTVILPSLGKAVDRSLETGILIVPVGFPANSKKDVRPKFMHELFKNVYDRSGYLRPEITDDMVRSLRSIRQLCFLFYKLVSDFTDEDMRAAELKFVEHDDNLVYTKSPHVDNIRETIAELLPDPYDINPAHSNGSTVTKIDNSRKRVQWAFNARLHGTYGRKYHNRFICDLLRPSPKPFVTESRLTIVPKDSRGPRIICMEPHETMFIQQGLMRAIYDHIENYSCFKGRINFTDQEVNRKLAYSSSIDKHYATIDLKDASDSVHWYHILDMFPTEWLLPLIATRSERVLLPSGKFHVMKKYAPMGSALCFPIEAIFFFSICKLVTDDVYVYGDDIIVPVDCVHQVIEMIEAHGLKVNRDKSFTSGHFRESCGAEYYYGHDISIVKIKSLTPGNTISIFNEFLEKYGEEFCNGLIDRYHTYSTRCKFKLKFVPVGPEPDFVHVQRRSYMYVHFYVRGRIDYQKMEIFAPVKMVNTPLPVVPDDYLIDEWFASRETATPIISRKSASALQGIYHPTYKVKHRTIVVNFDDRGVLLSEPKRFTLKWATFLM